MNRDPQEVRALIIKIHHGSKSSIINNRPASRSSSAKLMGCTFAFLLLLCLLSYYSDRSNNDHPSIKLTYQSANNSIIHNNDEPRTDVVSSPLFIFGHSTGHTGSGSFHQSIMQPGCRLWNTTADEFEYLAEGEKKWKWSNDVNDNYDYDDCSFVNDVLIPHLKEVVNNLNGTTIGGAHNASSLVYLDMGHFHNRGHTLQCLAKHLQHQSIFIHIRRNRYDIARSFTDSMARLSSSHPTMKITPCLSKSVIHKNQSLGHPFISTCPRSTEHVGSVNLPVENDAVWDALNTYQQFLWYVDEMEHRWYTLQNMFQDNTSTAASSPRFIEVTWNNNVELQKAVNYVREQLGCTPVRNVIHQHPHVSHTTIRNCSRYIWDDLQYRKIMGYSDDTTDVLFTRVPQHVGGEECSESGVELKENIAEYSKFHSVEYDENQWVVA